MWLLDVVVSGRLRSLPNWPEVKTFKCHQEVTEPDREGFIQYTNMGYTNGTCSIVFRGEQRDMVLINMDTLILRSEPAFSFNVGKPVLTL